MWIAATISICRRTGAALAVLAGTSLLQAQDDAFKAPDRLLLKNGTMVHGLIIRNTRNEVVLQERFGEKHYPKSEIVRIYDEPDTGIEFTDLARRGDLPAWRVIANDLRTRDVIKSLVQIPATVIDNGVFRNVPYLSFKLNKYGEFNVYGDPDDPAGIEIGVYGSRGNSTKVRKALRSFLAGFLATREELRALYSIPLEGGISEAGGLTVEITPSSAPDAYGAWWISLYNKKELDAVRLSDAEYERLVRPVDEVVVENAPHHSNKWTKDQLQQSRRVDSSAQVLLRGFYRDANGVFRLITGPDTSAR